MDEQDFTELISAFLRGGDSQEPDNKKNKESIVTAGTEQPTGETEIRKNIIEALAEKIKESHDSSATDEVATATTLEKGNGADILMASPLVDDMAGSNTDAPIVKETPCARVEDQVITQEEANILFNKGKEAGETGLRKILSRFTDLDGIHAALLVTRDGFIVDHASDSELDADAISAIVATGFGVLDRIGGELHQGELKSAIIEYEQGPIALSPLSMDVVLAVVATQWATLGRIRLEIKKQTETLIASL